MFVSVSASGLHLGCCIWAATGLRSSLKVRFGLILIMSQRLHGQLNSRDLHQSFKAGVASTVSRCCSNLSGYCSSITDFCLLCPQVQRGHQSAADAGMRDRLSFGVEAIKGHAEGRGDGDCSI